MALTCRTFYEIARRWRAVRPVIVEAESGVAEDHNDTRKCHSRDFRHGNRESLSISARIRRWQREFEFPSISLEMLMKTTK
jgi:hypothetical protein